MLLRDEHIKSGMESHERSAKKVLVLKVDFIQKSFQNAGNQQQFRHSSFYETCTSLEHQTISDGKYKLKKRDAILVNVFFFSLFTLPLTLPQPRMSHPIPLPSS
jgi:hypothetical protein